MLEIKQISSEKSNLKVEMANLIKIYPQFKIANFGSYFPYNQQFEDLGWGCAWRAIQTLLSVNKIQITFANLYNQFNRKKVLLDLIKSQSQYDNKAMQFLQGHVWAPQQIERHWAQPFIGRVICWKFGLKNKLLLLNGYPKAYAPQLVFNFSINFNQFLKILRERISHTTIMIDDGIYALSILGIDERGEEIEILFGDPHISNNKQQLYTGIYTKIYTLEGDFIRNGEESMKNEKYRLYNVISQLQFKNKNWMILVIQ